MLDLSEYQFRLVASTRVILLVLLHQIHTVYLHDLLGLTQTTQQVLFLVLTQALARLTFTVFIQTVLLLHVRILASRKTLRLPVMDTLMT